MKILGVIANCDKPEAGKVLQRVLAKTKELGMEILAEPATADLFNIKVRKEELPELFKKVDAIMAFGGDGTVLRVVRELNGLDVPLMGVNLGGLGFLTSVAESELENALECLVSNKFTVSLRTIAECTVTRGEEIKVQYRALNDIVIAREALARVITLDVQIDKNYVTSYVCDGLIISTPTGSTGHSLSAGGPIVTPEAVVFVLCVICPHTLSSRPLVVPDTSEISVKITNCKGRVILSIDGQVGVELQEDDYICVRRSDKGVRFIHLPGYNYFSLLRQKLHWRGSATL
jgi:NAD+ kinase